MISRRCGPLPRFVLPSCAPCSSARLGELLVVVASVCCRHAVYRAAAASCRASKSISTTRRRFAAAPSRTSPLSSTLSSCVRFGDALCGVAVCGGWAPAAACIPFARMNSTSLLALRRCREFGRLGEHTEGLCATVKPAPAVSPAVWLASPVPSPAVVCSFDARMLLCLLAFRRGHWLSCGRAGCVGERCAFALLPPVVRPACAGLGTALSCAGPWHVFWNLKVTLTPWSSTECKPLSSPSLHARRISCHCCLPSRIRLGAPGVSVWAPRLAELSDIENSNSRLVPRSALRVFDPSPCFVRTYLTY